MLFTWSTENLCIVFPQWRITGTFSLLLSLFAVAAMTAGYELVRTMSRKYDASSEEYANALPSTSSFVLPLAYGVAMRKPCGCPSMLDTFRTHIMVPGPSPDRFSVDPVVNEDERPRLWQWIGKLAVQQEQRAKMTKAAFYAAQVFYSFFIMYVLSPLHMHFDSWTQAALHDVQWLGHVVGGSWCILRSSGLW